MPGESGISKASRTLWIPRLRGNDKTLSEKRRSGMHARAFGDLVDELLVLAQRKADDVHGVGRILLDSGAVGCVVAGCEHVLDIEREARTRRSMARP
jgi:hypothetical protein